MARKLAKLWSPKYNELTKQYELKYKFKGEKTKKKLFKDWESAVNYSGRLLNDKES